LETVDRTSQPFEPKWTQRLYGELRSLADAALAAERATPSVSPTDLAHEAWLRLSAQRNSVWQGRSHFLSVAATMLRRILVDRARRRAVRRRGAALVAVAPDAIAREDERAVDLLRLEDALQQLERRSARVARVVELRFFGGSTFDEVAEALGVSVITAKRDWEYARAWLHRELAEA
jgi:RNA polymerase sigma factor (TIGR02999 family)